MDKVSKNDSGHRILRLLLIGLIICILAGIHRKYPPHFVQFYVVDILQLTDILAMILFAPLCVLVLWKVFLLYDGICSGFAMACFILGVFALGIGFGMHDTFNSMQRFYGASLDALPDACRSVKFFDNKLGHWSFFAGFGMITLAVTFSETRNPLPVPISNRSFVCLLIASSAVAVLICKNMMNEASSTAADIFTLLAVSAITAVFHLNKGAVPLKKLPVATIIYVAYGGGAVMSVLFKLAVHR